MEAGGLFASGTVTADQEPIQGELFLEPALAELEDGLKDALSQAAKVSSALKQWRKSCAVGHMAQIKKNAETARDAATRLQEAVAALSRWSFDVERYLQEGHWQKEIASALQERHGMRARIEGSELVSTPVALRARPADGALSQGKKRVPEIRPSFVADRLASTRRRLQEAKTAELLEALYGAWKARRNPQTQLLGLKEAYEVFCLAPGWRKENSKSAFAESITALHQSGEQVTRDGRRLHFEFQQGTSRQQDMIIVRDAEGRELRFLGVHFV